MSLVIGKGNKPFVWNHTFEVEYSGSTMESCQIKLNNIFTKILSKKEMAVFGDYTVYILYSSANKKKRMTYYAKSMSATFYDIIPYDIVQHDYKPADNTDMKVNVEFLFQPSCKYNFEIVQKAGYINAYWKVQYDGEMNVSLLADAADEMHDDVKNVTIDHASAKAVNNVNYSGADSTSSKQNSSTKVRRINQSLNIPVGELLEMDPDQLNIICEGNDSGPTI